MRKDSDIRLAMPARSVPTESAAEEVEEMARSGLQPLVLLLMVSAPGPLLWEGSDQRSQAKRRARSACEGG